MCIERIRTMSAKLSDVVLCSLNPEQSGRLLKNLHFLSTAFSADACTAKITHKSDPQGFVQVSTKVARGCEVLKLSCEFGRCEIGNVQFLRGD